MGGGGWGGWGWGEGWGWGGVRMGEGGVGGRSDANNWRVGWGIYLAVPPHTHLTQT